MPAPKKQPCTSVGFLRFVSDQRIDKQGKVFSPSEAGLLLTYLLVDSSEVLCITLNAVDDPVLFMHI
jgi:hypothetical protein